MINQSLLPGKELDRSLSGLLWSQGFSALRSTASQRQSQLSTEPQSEQFIHFLLGNQRCCLRVMVILYKQFVNVCALCTLTFKELGIFLKSKQIILEREASTSHPVAERRGPTH